MEIELAESPAIANESRPSTPAPASLEQEPRLAAVGLSRAPIAVGSPRAPSRADEPRDAASSSELLTAHGDSPEVARLPAPAPSASSLEARLDAFDPNHRPSWMPAKSGAGLKVGEAPGAEALAAKVSRDLAQGSDDRARSAGGRGGPVASAAHEAAASVWAPQTGYAVIAVDLDDKGHVARVSLVDASGDRADWQKVADGIQKGLADKKVDVPAGAGGLRVTVKVEAKLAYPSGASHPVTGPSLGNDGTQATASVAFDLADVGQKPKRMVGVVVLSETRL